ncbi:MAG TPA: NifU N-terminal domain-containing protein [Acidobacteriota bacterium]|nr:NifU N-terminal domain-containing protein [Acidobacteriota bacterium]
MKKSRSVGKSLRKYEITNFLFFLGLIAALVVMVSLVFRHYGSRGAPPQEEFVRGVVSEILSDGSDIGVFYLGASISATSQQFKSRLDIPITDGGLVQGLFDLPGVEEVTINDKVIIITKNTSANWREIRAGVMSVVNTHVDSRR